MCGHCLKNTLICSLNGGHTLCSHGTDCDESNHINMKQPFICHCKFCMAPEICHTEDIWLDEQGKLIRNKFKGY